MRADAPRSSMSPTEAPEAASSTVAVSRTESGPAPSSWP